MRIRWAAGENEATDRGLTIGNFDGVHLGHRNAIERLVAASRARSLEPTVLLFDPHPLAVIAPDKTPRRLTSIRARIDLLKRCGAAAVAVFEFDLDAAAMEPETFVREVLAGEFRARLVVASREFRFGAGRRGDLTTIKRVGLDLGLDAIEAPTVEESGGAVSSTRIRGLLASGDVAAAARLLGRPHSICGVVERGDGRGRTLGFPTANLGEVAEMAPAEGIYAAWARWGASHHPAAVHVGRRLTFDDRFAVEAHVLGVNPDLYGRNLEIAFVERLRDNEMFDGPEALAVQIARDVRAAAGILDGAPPGWMYPCPGHRGAAESARAG